MITLHRTGQYRFYVNSGYVEEKPYICVEQHRHFAKFALAPFSLTANNGFSRTEINRVRQAVQDVRDMLLTHWDKDTKPPSLPEI
jgi:hypothetical protein